MTDVVSLAAELLAIQSTTGSEAGAVDFVSRWLVARGWNVTLQEVTRGRANVWASRSGGGVTFSTHLDTVPPYLPPRLEGSRLFGRGASDAKGIAAAMMVAADRLVGDGEKRVELLFVVGEEKGSDGARAANNLGSKSRYLINGWEVSQITTLQSSPPATASLNVTGSAFTGAAYSGSLNGLGGSGRVPFVPLNGIDVDRIFRVDARLTKTLPFTESINLSLYFEGFNIFNTPYDTSVRTAQYQVANQILSPISSFRSGTASQAFPDGTNARRAQVGLRLTF